MLVSTRKARMDDTLAIAQIHRNAFERQRNSETWVSATLAAEPRFYVFVLEVDSKVAGYIFWAQKSGFRPDPVLELDQIALRNAYRGKGHAETLIRESLEMVESELQHTGQALKAILVSTRYDNKAQRLYEKALGVRVVATIGDLYSAAEVIMLHKR